MKTIHAIVCFAVLFLFAEQLRADDSISISRSDWQALTQRVEKLEKQANNKRLTLGGYGEAVYRRNFYSSNPGRYKQPEQYRGQQYGQFDLPHVCFYVGYDFGKGWRLSSEIEFEHGGVEAAMEVEGDEGIEYESEVERGGEVALEQLWIEKQFSPMAKLRAGMLIVPIGGVNAHHEPNQFFGTYRPEGELTILPCTWHDIGLQLAGRYKWLQYTAQLLPGLQSNQFGNSSWIHYGSASMFEYKLGTTLAGLARLDFYPLHRGEKSSDALRISLSGYTGTSFRNTFEPTEGTDYQDVHGLVSIGAVDWSYKGHGLIFRGSCLYGHLNDAEAISTFNRSMPKNSNSKRQHVASDAYSCGAELGYDFFTLNPVLREKRQQFFLFARYDAYDAMARVKTVRKYWAGRQKLSLGINYMPIPEVIVKAEYCHSWINKSPTLTYNPEPYVALSVAYFGMFEF
ncbi:MAG: hypothetical protein KBS77_02140 [Bacteroidales bacterium]|nr:hypothetical protein [Candidatus Colicola faecequi]